MKTQQLTSTPAFAFEMTKESDLGNMFVMASPRSGMSIYVQLPSKSKRIANNIMRVGKKYNMTAHDAEIKKAVVPFYRQFDKRNPF